MTDVQLAMTQRPDSLPACDIALDGYDLAADDGLRTAVILSLFLDRRADDSDAVDGDDRGGSWMDQYLDDPGDKLGSRLWLLRRQKQTPDVLVRARTYAEEALQWLLDDGIAGRVSVNATNAGRDTLKLDIAIERLAGNRWEEAFQLSMA